jgi:microcystin-dependent protein
MEGTIGEIRCFAADFEPRNWAFCRGQVINKNQNPPLFSVLGNVYGGDGVQTFAYPDLRGRAPIGTQDGSTAGNYQVGQRAGSENTILSASNMPLHNHTPTVTAGAAGSGTGTITLNATNNPGTSAIPTGNLFGGDSDFSGIVDVYSAAGPAVVDGGLAAGSVTLTATAAAPGVVLAAAGATQPHNNMQPSIGINFIICLYGEYPSRG